MSADNFIAIVEKGGKYTGYMCCASLDYPILKDYECCPIVFSVSTLKDAILAAQNIYTEYGYVFVNILWEQKGLEMAEGD